VHVRVLPKGPTLQLTHDESQEKMDPVFSPDGATVAYTVPFQTWTVPIGGGKPQLWLPNAAGLRWVDGNTLLFSTLVGNPGSLRGMAVATSDASRTREQVVYAPATPLGMAHRGYGCPVGSCRSTAVRAAVQSGRRTPPAQPPPGRRTAHGCISSPMPAARSTFGASVFPMAHPNS
jgi:hypothetical protein